MNMVPLSDKMHMRLSDIFLSLLLAVLLSACAGKEERIIPRGKLAEIYAEMLMTDQWIQQTPGVRQIADTSLVYQPILEKYGYTSDDYRVTVEHYLDDPERFARILRKTSDILDRRIEELKKEQERLEEIRRKSKITTDFSAREHFPYLFGEPYAALRDSLAVELDSVTCSYRFLRMAPRDTTVLPDSLAVKDSLALSDTLAVTDSLAVSDSLAVIDSLSVQAPDKELLGKKVFPAFRNRTKNSGVGMKRLKAAPEYVEK